MTEKINKIKKKKKINVIVCAALSALVLCFAGCSSSPKAEKDAWYEENSKDFSLYTLKNGIPVIFKKTNGGQVFVLRTVFEGGTPLVSREFAGIESLTLEMMFHGSKKFSYEDIQNMQYAVSFSMNHSSGRDYSVTGIKCLQKDLDTVLEVYADSIISPAFLKEDFNQLLLNTEDSIQRTMAEPDGQLAMELEKAAFGNSAYSSPAQVTEESIKKMTLEALKTHHKKLLDAGRIKFVIVANMESEVQQNLVEKLDGLFGQIQPQGYKRPEIPKIAVEGEDLFIKNEQAGTAGYSVGFFDCPERYDEDYVPFALALMFLDDIFFDQVREKAGAVYSVGTGVLGGRQMLGAVSAYKISDLQNIHSLIEKAMLDFPDEKNLAGKLEQYKNKYITTLFESSQSGTGVAANIITSLEYSGKPDTYLKRSAQVQNVTAKQVYEAYKKYLAPDTKTKKIRWITVASGMLIPF